MQEKTPYTEYRKLYQQKFILAYKNKQIQNDFENLKIQSKIQISKWKYGKLTEEESYEWLLKNK